MPKAFWWCSSQSINMGLILLSGGRSPILLPRTTSAPAAQSSPHLSSSLHQAQAPAQVQVQLSSAFSEAGWLPCSSSRIQERDRGRDSLCMGSFTLLVGMWCCNGTTVVGPALRWPSLVRCGLFFLIPFQCGATRGGEGCQPRPQRCDLVRVDVPIRPGMRLLETCCVACVDVPIRPARIFF